MFLEEGEARMSYIKVLPACPILIWWKLHNDQCFFALTPVEFMLLDIELHFGSENYFASCMISSTSRCLALLRGFWTTTWLKHFFQRLEQPGVIGDWRLTQFTAGASERKKATYIMPSQCRGRGGSSEIGMKFCGVQCAIRPVLYAMFEESHEEKVRTTLQEAKDIEFEARR